MVLTYDFISLYRLNIVPHQLTDSKQWPAPDGDMITRDGASVLSSHSIFTLCYFA